MPLLSGVVSGLGRPARVQATHASPPPLDDSPLLAVQSRLGLAHPHPGHIHCRLHAVRGRVPAQGRTKQIQRARQPVQVKHTRTRLTALFSGTTQVSRYQKGKTSLDFTETRDSEWQ